MAWSVLFADEFYPEFLELPEVVQDELLVMAKLLEQFGPGLGRPRADTLSGSKHANMKELRFSASALQRCRRCVACRVCLRSEAGSHPAGRWRQERRGPEAVLQAVNPQGG